MMRFLKENKRKPSRYVADGRNLRNWWKATKALILEGIYSQTPLRLLEGSGRGALYLDGLDFFELVDEFQKRLTVNLELF